MPASKGAVKVEGVREYQLALKRVSDGAADMTSAHRAVAGRLVPGIALRSPRRTGALASSWVPGATKGRARITSRVLYAGPIEYGWPARHIEPARMVRDTVEASTREIREAYESEIARLGARAGFEVKA
jgi:hypothetical protein